MALAATDTVRSGSAVRVVVEARAVSDALYLSIGTNHVLTSLAVSTCPAAQVGTPMSCLHQ